MACLVNDEYYIKVLLLNPQLEKLTLKNSEEKYIPPLLKHAPNLKNLHFISDRIYSNTNIIHRDEYRSHEKFFKSFNSKEIRKISKIKNLEVLSLGATSFNSGSDFLHLVTDCPYSLD